MEAKKREWGDGARTVKEGEAVDCSQWRQFRVAEVRYEGVKIEYRKRKLDLSTKEMVES